MDAVFIVFKGVAIKQFPIKALLEERRWVWYEKSYIYLPGDPL
jgi:hypothetical protein